MTTLQLSERAIRVAVLGFSVVGLIALSIIATLTAVEDIHIWEAEDHVGDRVRIDGTFIGSCPPEQGSLWAMIMEANETLEIFIERGDGGIVPGSRITVEGEVVTIDGAPTLTVQNQERVIIESEGYPETLNKGIEPGNFYHVLGSVRSSRYLGWEHQQVLIDPIAEGHPDTNMLVMDLINVKENLRTGDLVNITAYFSDHVTAFTYGDLNVKLLSRAEPRTLSLLRLVEDIREDPSSIPLEPITVDGYLRYPARGSSIYISDLVEGGDISIRATLPERMDELEKGDLVRLVNCSISWDVESMRFVLEPEYASLIERFGPWSLNLEHLEYGLTEFEGAVVEVRGIVVDSGDHVELIDGERRVRVLNWNGAMDEYDTVVTGRVVYDPITNSMHIDTEGHLI
jgi:hypothetical protein